MFLIEAQGRMTTSDLMNAGFSTFIAQRSTFRLKRTTPTSVIRTRDGFGGRSCDGAVRCGGRESGARRRTSAQKRIFNTGVRRRTIVKQFFILDIEQRLSREASTMDASFPYLCARDRVVLSATGMDGSLRGQILEYVFMYKYACSF